MQTELIKELNKVLKAFPQFWNGEELQRSMVSDAISQKQPDLIKALVANEKIRRMNKAGDAQRSGYPNAQSNKPLIKKAHDFLFY